MSELTAAQDQPSQQPATPIVDGTPTGGTSSARQLRVHRSFHWSAALVATLLSAIVTAMLAIYAGLYSAVRQCNQDASDIETQTDLDFAGDRRPRGTDEVVARGRRSCTTDRLRTELVHIESSAEGYYGNPLFKEHSFVSLVDQYNRLLRRVQFPKELTCGPDEKCAATGLDIDTQTKHPDIETLNITGADPRAFAADIASDKTKLDKQQDWHRDYGPVRLCAPWKLAFGSEPWHLIRLDMRTTTETKLATEIQFTPAADFYASQSPNWIEANPYGERRDINGEPAKYDIRSNNPDAHAGIKPRSHGSSRGKIHQARNAA